MSNLIDYAETLENVKIIRAPVFILYNIDRQKLEVTSKTCSVVDFFSPTIEYIKMNQRKMFHIFEISDNYARWYEEDENIDWIRHIRKEKIKKINKNI